MTAVDCFYEPERRGELARWSVASMLVMAAHIVATSTYLLLRPPPDGGAAAPVIDVEFVPPEAATPAADVAAPEPPVVESSKEEPLPAPEPPSRVEPVQPPIEAVSPPPPPEQTAPSETPVLPPPPPNPVEVERAHPKPPVVRPEHRSRNNTPGENKEERRQERKEGRKNTDRHELRSPMRVATAPNPGEAAVGEREAEAGWRSALMARLQRAKPAGTRDSGTVELSFTMDRSGRVLSRRVARTSGSATLDAAALAMIDRAQPLPAFPPSMREARKTLNLPVRFSVR